MYSFVLVHKICITVLAFLRAVQINPKNWSGLTGSSRFCEDTEAKQNYGAGTERVDQNRVSSDD